MRMRGPCYFKWADSQLPNFSHVEDYAAGFHIDVVVRRSRHGITQLFLGTYNSFDVMLFEEYIEALPDRDLTQAMQWGIERARAFIDGSDIRKIALISAAQPEKRDQTWAFKPNEHHTAEQRRSNKLAADPRQC
jgi:hypothetical protein